MTAPFPSGVSALRHGEADVARDLISSLTFNQILPSVAKSRRAAVAATRRDPPPPVSPEAPDAPPAHGVAAERRYAGGTDRPIPPKRQGQKWHLLLGREEGVMRYSATSASDGERRRRTVN
ncbi:MAG TPA: hypothetical protein VMD59_19490 [Acidimicrobiales bacterium]|nr:hypothetical protein [Acidimicrobiales bacterium]